MDEREIPDFQGLVKKEAAKLLTLGGLPFTGGELEPPLDPAQPPGKIPPDPGPSAFTPGELRADFPRSTMEGVEVNPIGTKSAGYKLAAYALILSTGSVLLDFEFDHLVKLARVFDVGIHDRFRSGFAAHVALVRGQADDLEAWRTRALVAEREAKRLRAAARPWWRRWS